jgi:DNA-binding CsgD family transcriptional regulator/tetratricopeptide (TPR) repeat protein
MAGRTEGIAVDLLTALVERSLLHRADDPEPRLGMLETIREYASEQLSLSGELEEIRRRHAMYYLAFAEQSAQQVRGPEHATWLTRLDREHANFRQALSWFMEQREVEAGLRLARALFVFWQARGHLSEGRSAFAALLALPGAGPAPARAAALVRAGILARAQGDFTAALSLHEAALATYRQLDDKWGCAEALTNLAWTAAQQGDYAAANAHYAAALAVYQEAGDRHNVARLLTDMAHLAWIQGDNSRARHLFEENLLLRRQLGKRESIASALMFLGRTHQDEGDLAIAWQHFTESLAIYQELDDPSGMPWALNSLGQVARRQGDYASARRRFEEALAIARAHGGSTADSLSSLAYLARLQGDYEAARALHEAQLAAWQERGERRGVALSLAHLGAVDLDQGAWASAGARFQEALSLQLEASEQSSSAWSFNWLTDSHYRADPRPADTRGELDYPREGQAGFWGKVTTRSIATCLAGLGAVDAVAGRPARAARLLATADRLLEDINASLDALDCIHFERALVAARAALDESTWTSLWDGTRAQAVTPEQAIDDLLFTAPGPPEPPPTSQRPQAAPPEPATMSTMSTTSTAVAGVSAVAVLTGREREVAALIARGLTNREIAAELTIALRTADAHVEHIRNKLGMQTRAQVAVWAAEHGLHSR